MDRAEVRRRVLEAVDDGRIPPGGPSELAAYDLLDETPSSHWASWAHERAERMRRREHDRKEDPS